MTTTTKEQEEAFRALQATFKEMAGKQEREMAERLSEIIFSGNETVANRSTFRAIS